MVSNYFVLVFLFFQIDYHNHETIKMPRIQISYLIKYTLELKLFFSRDYLSNSCLQQTSLAKILTFSGLET